MYLNDLENYPTLNDGICKSMTCWDRYRIRFALWPSLQGTPKGTVCLLHGRAEFIEKYYEVIMELRQRGFAVATFDWRGQGMSERLIPNQNKGYVRKFSDYGKDLEQFIKKVMLPDCPPPHFVLAHSMGGLVLLSNLPRLRTMIERAVLSAPLIEIATSHKRLMGLKIQQSGIRKVSAFLRLFGQGAMFMPGVSSSPFDPQGFYSNAVTSDGPRYDRNRQFLIDFPKLAIGGPTVQWVHETCKVIDKLQSSDFQATIHTPTLIVTAGQDTVVNSLASEYFARTTRSVNSVGIAGSKHELMMERDMIRQQFWAAFDSFIPGEAPIKIAAA
ncbi:alpha/beta hydrolase [uncultured Cohaesibacter sp.]|uniref:alpha/beta hydrolase n=1 Tax=uncultured Cohaesibacter sp. TaxID=1002546 RepID=UPI0029303706|nr:alpha/beta hydrolase [uncultured Cohaesibacter sp.]